MLKIKEFDCEIVDNFLLFYYNVILPIHIDRYLLMLRLYLGQAFFSGKLKIKNLLAPPI